MASAAIDHDAAAAPQCGDPVAPGWLPLTEVSVQRIIELDDPALRNLWITQSYADLARRLLAVFGTDQSWCTFATWASATAGVSIRHAELPERVVALIESSDVRVPDIVDDANRAHPLLARLGAVGRLERSHVERLIRDALQQVSESVAHGNTLVYAELAPLFVRLVECLERKTFTWTCDHQAVLAAIGVPTREAKPLVNLAFDRYLTAAVASNPQTRAQHILTANVAAVLHEQRRLQGDIATALDAGLIDVGTALASEGRRTLPPRIHELVIDAVRQRVAPHVESLWEHIATHLLMTMNVPDGTLHLGRDVPPSVDGASLFPLALRDYTEPELSKLMGRWDLTGGTGRGSGASEWSDLGQRMNYIVNLFRSRQQHLVLTTPPFSQQQVDAMIAATADHPTDVDEARQPTCA